MKKTKTIIPVILCAAMLFTACGGSSNGEEASLFKPIETETASQQEVVEGSETTGQQEAADKSEIADQSEAASQQEENAQSSTKSSDDNPDVISEDQAYNAVINYNKAIGSGIDDELNTEGYIEYWDVSTNEDGKIVVLYRSYTAAQIRYYIDPVSGDAYVTELVPGIIDEEQENGETFNARDYLTEAE